MNISAFKPGDLDEIDLQPAQTPWRAHRNEDYARMLASHLSYTARDGDRIIACGGVIACERDVGMVWATIARGAGRRMLALYRMGQRLIEVSGKRIILANTECDFAQGCRLLKLLGFKRDERLPQHGPDGRDHWLYTRGM